MDFAIVVVMLAPGGKLLYSGDHDASRFSGHLTSNNNDAKFDGRHSPTDYYGQHLRSYRPALHVCMLPDQQPLLCGPSCVHLSPRATSRHSIAKGDGSIRRGIVHFEKV